MVRVCCVIVSYSGFFSHNTASKVIEDIIKAQRCPAVTSPNQQVLQQVPFKGDALFVDKPQSSIDSSLFAFQYTSTTVSLIPPTVFPRACRFAFVSPLLPLPLNQC